MLKIKRGFTLIEVIVSIALLGILAVAFLPSISNHFLWLVDTKTNITQKAFEIQDEMETTIQEVVIAMKSESGAINPTDYTSLGITEKVDFKLFEDDFTGYTSRLYPSAYKVEVSNGGNKKFVTLVGDKRIPELPVPEIKTKSLVFIKNDTEKASTHEYFDYLNLKIMAKSNMISNPQNSFNRYRSDWYVSKPGFIIPIQSIDNIDEDNDFGRIYPAFPEDYIALPIYSELGSAYSYIGATERNISVELKNDIVNKYPGSHISYTITPFAKSLKKGNTSFLHPLYIYGPNVTTNLALHLDASTINMSDKTNSSSTILFQDEEYYIRNWKNSRPSVETESTNSYKATQATKANMPVLVKDNVLLKPEIPFQAVEVEGITIYSVWGRALGNKSSTVATMNSSSLSIGNNWSAFIVMRRVDTPILPSIGSIIEGDGDNPWSIGWSGDLATPRLGFTQTTIRSELSSPLNLGEWYLVRVTANSPNLTLEANSLKKDINHNLTATGTISSINTNNIKINWNGVEISEILAYNANMNSTDLDKIKEYLTNKYNPN